MIYGKIPPLDNKKSKKKEFDDHELSDSNGDTGGEYILNKWGKQLKVISFKNSLIINIFNIIQILIIAMQQLLKSLISIKLLINLKLRLL